MDVYRFINSKAVREHLKNISYSFTAPEAAYIVHHSRYAALDEKIAAWQEIVDTMPNCSMPARLNMSEIPDFHEFLQTYIDLQRKKLQLFNNPRDSVYFYNIVWEYDAESEFSRQSQCDFCGPFSTASIALEHALRGALEEVQASSSPTAGRVRFYEISKRQLNDEDAYGNADRAIFLPSLNLQNVDIHYRKLTRREYDVDSAFAGMWFAFPTPFHACDIVYNPHTGIEQDRTPIVLTSICTWDSAKFAQEPPRHEYSEAFVHGANKRVEEFRETADDSDMTYDGYEVDKESEAPIIRRDVYPYSNYLNLEYYDKPLQGMQRALPTVGEYLRTGDVEFFVNTLAVFALQAYKAKMDDFIQCAIGCYTDSSLEAIGLSATTKHGKEDPLNVQAEQQHMPYTEI